VDETKRKLVVQMADEEYGEALGTVAAMIEQGIEDPDAFYDASYAYFMSGDYERATQWVDNTLRLAPQHLGARILLARICFLEERTSDGLAIAEFVLKNYAASLSAEDKEELAEVLDCYGTTKEDEIRAGYPAIARFLQVDDAAPKAQTEAFQPLAQQVQRIEAQPVQQMQPSQQSAADDEKEAVRLTQEILGKNIALLEKVHLLNSFAAGFFLAGSFAAAKHLLKQALGLDAHDEMTLKNMGYTLVALGERDAALELAARMKLPDFGLLAAVRG
jgi:putative tetratricopeptide repeat-containing domain protein